MNFLKDPIEGPILLSGIRTLAICLVILSLLRIGGIYWMRAYKRLNPPETLAPTKYLPAQATREEIQSFILACITHRPQVSQFTERACEDSARRIFIETAPDTASATEESY